MACALGVPACGVGATSRGELAEAGLEAIQANDVSRYRHYVVNLETLREHCSVAELDRAQRAVPQAHARLKGAIASCHRLVDWRGASQVGLMGGDVYERPRECGGHLARVSDIIATYVVGHERVSVHHRQPYLLDGRLYLAGRQPWCARQ